MTRKVYTDKGITIADIAKRANVSTATVSRVLNNSPKVTSKTSDKVVKVIKELNYSPNLMARQIAKKSPNNVIGYLVPNILNTFFTEFVKEVADLLAKRDYSLILCLFNDDPERLRKHLKVLQQTRAAGVLVGACHEDACIADFNNAKEFMHIVSIQADIDGVDRIDTTDFEGTKEVVDVLIKNGHKKIGFIGYGYDMSILNNRLLGYKQALESASIPVQEKYIMQGSHTSESGYEMATSLLRMQDHPTAIHCINEYMAQAAYRAIRDLGMRIPRDVSITAFDNLSTAQILEPNLTTCGMPIKNMARLSVDILFDRINGNTSPQHELILKTTLYERDSVGPI